MSEENYSMKEAMIFSQRVAQMSKALWKAVEKDWQSWIKPYNLNINEHHILWISYHLKGATISEIAKFGVMHVSTAFNFSKTGRPCSYSPKLAACIQIILSSAENFDFTISQLCLRPASPFFNL